MARRVCPCGVCESCHQPAICASCANLRSMEKYKLLKRLSQVCEGLSSRVNVLLIAKRKVNEQRDWRAEHAEYTLKLQDCLLTAKKELVKDRSRREQMHSSLNNSTKLLASASAQLTKTKSQQLEHFYPDLIRVQRLHHAAVLAEVFQKRRQVMRQLYKFLPLRCLTAGDAREQGQGANVTKHVRICGARLPIGDDLLSLPPHELAASLGYMVHLVNLSASYISAPLLHSAVFAASSSRIWQKSSYWDVRPASRSEEYPLFLPRKSSQAIVSEAGLEKSSSDSGFLSLEKPGYDESGNRGMSSIAYASTKPHEMHKDVQKGVKLLKRSIACILTYGYDLFSLPVPSNLSTYEAFAELLSLLSSKESRSRAIRLPGPRPTVGDGFLDQSAVSTSGCEDGITSSRLISKNSFRGRVSSLHESMYVGGDYEHLDRFGKPTESTFDGWDMVEHPTLPPPPSHSEDVEHWTRAMFIDATE